MKAGKGLVKEVVLDQQGKASAWIRCEEALIPSAGQYLQAWAPKEESAALATSIFPGGISNEEFLAVPPVPRSWEPGTTLCLHGPLGRGFGLSEKKNGSRSKRMAQGTRHIVLIALGETMARLYPLLPKVLSLQAAVTLFADCPLPTLPSAIEIYPLDPSESTLTEALAWADYLALDLPASKLPQLRAILGLMENAPLPCPAEALILTPMPCGGLGECGACAVHGNRTWKLSCKDGPVFNLNQLDW